MDLKIENMDYKKDVCDNIVSISDVEELIQLAVFRLSIPKGSFILDKSLGSELYKINPLNTDELEILSVAADALSDLKDITPVSATINNVENDKMTISLNLLLKNKEYKLELLAIA